MNSLIFLFTAYGITNIVVFSFIFTGLRKFLIKINPGFLGELITCMMCLSTWVGFGMSYILGIMGYPNMTPYGSIGIETVWLRVVLDGFITSGVVWLTHTIQEYFER